MTTPVTPLLIKDFFTTLLEDYLGTYKYPNGYTEPAISVGNPDNKAIASGLEVIIPLAFNSDAAYLTFNIMREDCIKIYLVQRSGKIVLPQAIEAIQEYAWCWKGYYLPQADLNKSFEAYCMELKVVQIIDSLYQFQQTGLNF